MARGGEHPIGDRSCYLLATASDWLEWHALLTGLGLQVTQPVEAVEPGAELADSITRFLQVVDLVFVVLPSDDVGTSSLLFEVGLAVGLKRPLVIAAPGGSGDVPPLLRYRPLALGEAARDPALLDDAIARALRPKRRARASGKDGRPALSRTDAVRLQETMTQVASEDWVEQLLIAANLRPQRSPSVKDTHFVRRPDFVVWNDAFEALFGSPVLPIEVLVRESALPMRLDQLMSVPRALNVTFALVITRDGGAAPLVEVSERGESLLIVSGTRLIHTWSEMPVPAALASLRNEATRRRSEGAASQW
jgi:hypothetical protein